ncbi:MAG: GtrA family protein [Actinobacteria bacterium]|nr:GtrA family protein [Actinomycetota bacterium]
MSIQVEQDVDPETVGSASTADRGSQITVGRRSLPLPRFLRRERILGQVVRFGLVGGLNTLVDYGLFNLLVVVFHMNPVAANPISVSAGIVNSFLWNKHWTFAGGGWHRWYRQAVLFVVVSVIGLLINTGGLWLLNHLTGADSVLALNLQKLGASIVSLTWNFVGYRFFVFSRKRETG